MSILAIVFVNTLIVAIAVLIHYEILFRLTKLLPRLRFKHQYRVVIGVAGALAAHVIEIWVFALAYFVMINYFGWGAFGGIFEGHLSDFMYFSFTTYTTLGYGDIQPYGHIRFLAGIESLVGLLLITWSASFLYIEMQNYWHTDPLDKD